MPKKIHPKGTFKDKIDFQAIEHNSSESLNSLLRNPEIMAAFSKPFVHNKLDLLSDPNNHGLHIMQAHNKFIEYLKNRVSLEQERDPPMS